MKKTRKMRIEPIQREEIYGNWKMLSPEGMLMCRVSEKKAQWYLSRDLATLEDEKTIRIKFEPNGVGDTSMYMLEDKSDCCVVCGVAHDLSFHHVVPYGYRRHFPEKWKCHSSHDNLLLCERCHVSYERAAWELKKRLQQIYAPIVASDREYRIKKLRAVKAAFALIRDESRLGKKHPLGRHRGKRHGHRNKELPSPKSIPPDRIEGLRALVAPYVSDFEFDTIANFVHEARKNLDLQDPAVDCGAVGLAVVAKGEDEIRSFIERWRKHFIDTTQPQFLSENWDIGWHKAE
jgi:hypothetical protein